MQIINYSDKAIAVIGNTKAHKQSLKQLGGRFNPYLRCGAGWIFSKRKQADVEALINSVPADTNDGFDMLIEDTMADRAGVGSSLSSYERGNY